MPNLINECNELLQHIIFKNFKIVDCTIIKEALQNDDLNLARVVADGLLEDIHTEFTTELVGDDFFIRCNELLTIYKSVLILNNKITQLYEGI